MIDRQRHRADVEVADPGRRLLDPAADHVELALEGLLVDALGVRDQDLLDLRPGRVGLLRRARRCRPARAASRRCSSPSAALRSRRSSAPPPAPRSRCAAGRSARPPAARRAARARCAAPGRRRRPPGSARGCRRRRRSCRRRRPRRGARSHFSALMPFSTTCRRGLPSIATTSPTPQDACSCSGWYSPSASSRANSASMRATQASSYLVMASLLAGAGQAAGLKEEGFLSYRSLTGCRPTAGL